MGDGLLVKTKNRSETVALKSIQCFGHRYIVFFFSNLSGDFGLQNGRAVLIEAKNI